jgi:hypothetical protein
MSAQDKQNLDTLVALLDDADLDNYYTKTEIDAMIGDIETLLEGI